MTRRKGSTVLGMFSIPQAMAEAAINELPPVQREAISNTQASAIMQICVDASKQIGAVLEGGPKTSEGAQRMGLDRIRNEQ